MNVNERLEICENKDIGTLKLNKEDDDEQNQMLFASDHANQTKEEYRIQGDEWVNDLMNKMNNIQQKSRDYQLNLSQSHQLQLIYAKNIVDRAISSLNRIVSLLPPSSTNSAVGEHVDQNSPSMTEIRMFLLQNHNQSLFLLPNQLQSDLIYVLNMMKSFSTHKQNCNPSHLNTDTTARCQSEETPANLFEQVRETSMMLDRAKESLANLST
ncbi:hypothetical protein BC833DRAFT_619939 [Globomyces pollinis-pini]|nr:hypothetical protein BC833DRAFT_619939 [Globomyces pollinis-pini]